MRYWNNRALVGSIQADAVNQAALITSGALAIASVASLGGAAAITVPAAYAYITLFGLKATLATFSGLHFLAATGPVAGFYALPFLPIVISAGINLYVRANARRTMIIASAQGNGNQVGVQFQWRHWATGATAGAWADIDNASPLGNNTAGRIVLAQSATPLERLEARYNGQWMAAIATENVAEPPQGTGRIQQDYYQVRVRTRLISGIDKDGAAEWADSPAADAGWVESPTYVLHDWTAAQFDDEGNLLPSAGTGFRDAHRPPRTLPQP